MNGSLSVTYASSASEDVLHVKVDILKSQTTTKRAAPEHIITDSRTFLHRLTIWFSRSTILSAPESSPITT
jgi:hypothetical protein